MRRAPHEGQNPQRLQGKCDQLLIGAPGAAQAQKAVRQDAAFEKGIELVFDKLRQARPGLRFDLGQEGLELFLDQLIQGRFFRAPSLVVQGNGVASRRRLNRWAHAVCLVPPDTVLIYSIMDRAPLDSNAVAT